MLAVSAYLMLKAALFTASTWKTTFNSKEIVRAKALGQLSVVPPEKPTSSILRLQMAYLALLLNVKPNCYKNCTKSILQ